MHELLLFGQVPSKRHDQLLKVLAGVAAMQPHLIVERHLIFRPRKPISSGARIAPKTGSQVQALQVQMQGDLFFLQLVGNVTASASPGPGKTSAKGEDVIMGEGLPDNEGEHAMNGTGSLSRAMPSADHIIDLAANPWSIEFRDLPEVPGRRPATSRLMASVPVTDGDPWRVMDDLGYNYSTEYVLQGNRFIHNNIILFLHRPLMVPSTSDQEHVNNVLQSNRAVDPLPPLENLKPLDSSGGFILQASIRVQDGNKPESMSLAMNELTRFRDLMKGVVDLEVGNRLALDTRMR